MNQSKTSNMSENSTRLTLFIKNLPNTCKKEDLDQIFVKFGATSTNVITSSHNGKIKGYLNFDDHNKKEKCKNHFIGKKILGQVVIIEDFHHKSKPQYKKTEAQPNHQPHQDTSLSSFAPLKRNKQLFEEKKVEKGENVHKTRYSTKNNKVISNKNNHQNKTQSVGVLQQNALGIQANLNQLLLLQQAEVKIKENEKRVYQKYHLVFVCDASGSMAGSRWNQVATDLNQTLTDRKNNRAKDLVSIISFNDTATTHCESLPLQKYDFSQVIGSIGNTVGGGTNFGNALTEAHRLISIHIQKHPKRIPVLVFLSDGEDQTGDSEMKNLVQEFRKNKLKVFVIAFCNDNGKQKLENLSKIGKGKFFNSSQQMDLKKVFTKIEKHLEITIQNKIALRN